MSFAAARALYEMGDYSGGDILIEVLSGRRSASCGLIQGGMRDAKKKVTSPLGLVLLGARSGAGAAFPGAGFGVRLMEEAAKDRAAPGRLASAKALTGDANPTTVQRLASALNDRSALVRVAVARTLGDLASPEAIPGLQVKLKDGNSALRCMSAASIIRISEAQMQTAAQSSAGHTASGDQQ